jgi:small conductance mechanosensitive channel
VRDVIGGFFILGEGPIAIGDVVTISNVTGEVQQVRPRVTVLRGIDGNVYYVPNGSIVVSTNQSQEYGYDTDVDRVFDSSKRSSTLSPAIRIGPTGSWSRRGRSESRS